MNAVEFGKENNQIILLLHGGGLFCLAADELADISFAEAMEKLQLFLTKLLEVFNTSKQDICALTADFIRGLPKDIAIFLELPALKGISALKND